MDPDRNKAEEFLDVEDSLSHLRLDDEEEEREREEEMEEEEEEEDEEEEDAKIFNAWMLRYRAGEHQDKPEKGEAEEEEQEAETPGCSSRTGTPVRMRVDRRASLPCPVRTHLKTQQVSNTHRT